MDFGEWITFLIFLVAMAIQWFTKKGEEESDTFSESSEPTEWDETSEADLDPEIMEALGLDKPSPSESKTPPPLPGTPETPEKTKTIPPPLPLSIPTPTPDSPSPYSTPSLTTPSFSEPKLSSPSQLSQDHKTTLPASPTSSPQLVRVKKLLHQKESIRDAILLQEILSPPVSLRNS